MELFDTHAHLLDKRFDADREDIANGFNGNGIKAVLEAATSLKQAKDIVALTGTYKEIYGAIGTHPHDAKDMEDGDIRNAIPYFANDKIVAVGEIGLDYHYDFSPRQIQKQRFEEQLNLAVSLRLPVILHVREASKDALDILSSYKNNLSGVMHCFSGSYETACACIDMGLYIAFGGALTFTNAATQVENAKKLPMERLLIETDCPYMTPHPYRKNRNEPAYVSLVCQKLAEIRKISPEKAACETLNNAKALFKINF